MTTLVAKPGSFLAEILPVIGPDIFEEEMEIRRLMPLILEIMKEPPPRFATVEDEEGDLPWMLRDFASVLRFLGPESPDAS